MTLTKEGLSYICKNFGDLSLCCVRTGLSWYTTVEGTDYPETGGTYQIVNRLVLGLCETLTMTNPDRGTFTQADLYTANTQPVTLEDTRLIAEHDDTSADQWCFGAEPPPDGIPWVPIIAGLAIAATVGVVVWQVKKK